MRIRFLGTGGGRFATINQKRMTGGFRIEEIDGKNMHVDPGPGALIRCHQFKCNPRKLDIVFVSHCHTDHYNDAEILIEAMTQGMKKKKGYILGSKSVIEGYGDWGPCISKYHKSKSEITSLDDGDTTKIDNIHIKATRTIHGDPKCVGFNLEYNGFKLGYTSDTEYFPELHKEFEDVDILIASVIKDGDRKIKGHMRTQDFQKLIEEVQPKTAIMTHMGVNLIMNNPFKCTRDITEKTGIRTISATDGFLMSLNQYLN
ncbi:MAG: MBL fold metallo-hydrolase [Methanobacteriaceae archaeon]|nr:MBL fold metallo-hydrolase [Methanobacteriaceae archaeon]